MTQSTPSDLAIAFRSLPRRLREASAGDVDQVDIGTATATVEDAINAAASLMNCESTANDVASLIERRPLVEWTAAQLSQLQSYASASGAAIRELQDRNDKAH